MSLSIVATLSGSPPWLEDFYTRVSTAAWILTGDDYELIVVHAGEGEAEAAAEPDSHLRLLRSTGHGKAADLLFGLAEAKGERAFIIDINSREDPEWVLAFSAEMDEGGADFIYSVRQPRTGIGALLSRMISFFIGQSENFLSAALMNSAFRKAALAAGTPHILASRPLPLPEYRQQPFAVIINPAERG